MSLTKTPEGINRIPMLLSGILGMVILGLIYGWSIFRAPLQDLFPDWTETMLSNAFTILMCSFAMGSMLSGAIARKLPRQGLCAATAVLLFIGFMGVSFIDPSYSNRSLWQLYGFYCILCGFGTGIGYNMISSNIVDWFDDCSGTVLGAGLMGYGLGALIMGGVAKSLIEAYGLPMAFRIIGIGGACFLLLILPFQRRPKRKEPTEHAPEGALQDTTNEVNIPPAEVLHTFAFWALMLWSVLISASCLMVVNSAASISAYYGASAVLGLIISLANGIARVCNGMISDRFGFRKMSGIHHIIIFLAVAAMLAGGQMQSKILITAGLVFTGFSFGFTPTSVAVFVRKKYGAKYFSANYSFFSWGLFFAALLGPTLCGIIQEQLKMENYYMPVFGLMAVYGIIGFLLSIPLRKAAKF